MAVPVWALLGFAAWTVAVLLFPVGIYRWSRILTGRASIRSFRADVVEGEDWYKRAMRAHANCIENLPVFAAIVLILHIAEITSATVDALAGMILGARIVQSLIHLSFVQTNTVVSVRFTFFLAQIVGFLWLIAIIVVEGR